MRRILLTVVASTAMLAIAPATSLASHHHGRHHRHARVEHFGSDASQTGASNSASSSTDNAGTVASFSGGVLTIKLNDGSMVSGRVTGDTELECQAPENAMSHDGGGDGSGDNGSGDDNQQAGGDDNQAGENEATENEDQNEAAENDNDDAESCSTANLTPGTVVREAELRVSGAGSTWKKVELITG